MNKERFNSIPSELQAEVDALANLPDDEIQTDDIPEVRDWSGAKRGVFYRPQKEQVTLQLDADLVKWFKENKEESEEYQNRINYALREYVSRQSA